VNNLGCVESSEGGSTGYVAIKTHSYKC